MKITILCSSAEHPINPYLDRWMECHAGSHTIEVVREKAQARGGDLLFLISCAEIVTQRDRAAYSKTLVIHASDLPLGRGWSPYIWQILEGKEKIPVTLLEAEDKVDSGNIWHQVICNIPKHALWDEINDSIFDAELTLMDYAVSNFSTCKPKEQASDIEPTYYPKRKPSDSEVSAEISLAEQFDKIRVSDPHRFPAYFFIYGHKYKLIVEKLPND